MPDPKPSLQRLSGCAACKHSQHKDPQGQDPHAHGKDFWCPVLSKAVDTRDGTTCTRFES